MKRLILGLTLAMLGGCGAKSFDYRSANEIPEGPGLFSGEKGAFVLYDSKQPRGHPERDAGSSPVEKARAAKFAEDQAEFEAYREYLRWKDSATGTAEYRDFQDWKEWKAYRKWKESQAK